MYTHLACLTDLDHPRTPTRVNLFSKAGRKRCGAGGVVQERYMKRGCILVAEELDGRGYAILISVKWAVRLAMKNEKDAGMR